MYWLHQECLSLKVRDLLLTIPRSNLLWMFFSEMSGMYNYMAHAQLERSTRRYLLNVQSCIVKLFELVVLETSLKTLDLNSDIAGVKAFVC